jgi:predicted enzyme related to lactoylglutathione lyase
VLRPRVALVVLAAALALPAPAPAGRLIVTGHDADRRCALTDQQCGFLKAALDVEAALAKAESLGGTRVFGPDEVTEGVEIGQFLDPEGHVIGVTKANA